MQEAPPGYHGRTGQAHEDAMSRSYEDLLRDPRWFERRRQVLEERGEECDVCGIENAAALRRDGCSLNVHHIRYCGPPWESPDEDLQILCLVCHADAHDGKNEMKAQNGRVQTSGWLGHPRPRVRSRRGGGWEVPRGPLGRVGAESSALATLRCLAWGWRVAGDG